MSKTKLRPLDWQIYNILKTQNDWITQKELCLKVLNERLRKEEYIDTQDSVYNEICAIYELSNDEFHNTQWRHIITKSIRDLNASSVIQKIILSSGKGIKIANETEYKAFIGRQINSAIRRLQRVKKMADKASKDGQMRITFNKERDYIEAFIKNYEDIKEIKNEYKL